MTSQTGTFAGFPTENRTETTRAAIIGLPHGTPYDKGDPGHSFQAPKVIREASARFADRVHSYDFDLGRALLKPGRMPIIDAGDVAGDPFHPEENRTAVTNAVREILDTGAVPVAIGGDDSVPIPYFQAFEGRGPFTLIQIDAHIDWRHERSGESMGFSSTMRRASEMPWIDRIIQVGIRGVGSAGEKERSDALDYGVKFISAEEVHRSGIQPVLDRIPEGPPCLITLDCDAFDPAVMPAVAAPLPGGLNYWHVTGLIKGIAQKSEIAGFDLVEFVPEKDNGGAGALLAVKTIWNVLGAIVAEGQIS